MDPHSSLAWDPHSSLAWDPHSLGLEEEEEGGLGSGRGDEHSDRD